MTELNGVLPVDKPAGPTSHDVVAAARRGIGMRRVGHTGTLDPFASGLLLLCLGPATRLAEYLTPLRKTYRATLRLGVVTDTDDHTGEPVATSDAWRGLDEGAIRAALAAQVGTIRQLPPAYSAKRVAGERAYEAARRGRTLALEPVEVTVHRIEVRRVEPPEVDFEVECSSGTYIRSIARDAGEALGVGAHLVGLRRTGIGRFHADDALVVDALADREAVERALVPPLAAVSHLPAVAVGEELARMVAQGRAVPAPADAPAGEPLALASAACVLLAIAERRGGLVHPRKVFA